MRVRLAFESPLPPYRCWHKVGKDVNTIRDLQHDIFETFQLRTHCKSLRLDLDGFYLVPSSPIDGLLHENDIVSVKRRVKKDRALLPPHFSAKGLKRKQEDREPKEDIKSRKKKKVVAGKKEKRSKPVVPCQKSVATDSSDSDSNSSSSEDEDDSSNTSSDSSSDSSSSSSSESSSSSTSSSSSSDSESESEAESSSKKATVARLASRTNRQTPKPTTNAPAATTTSSTAGPRRQAPPFQGLPSTRKRNARRKLVKLAHQQGAAQQAAQSQQEPGKQDHRNTSLKSGSSEQGRSAPARNSTTTGNTANTAAIRNQGSNVQHQKPNVFITTSELDDRGSRRASQSQKGRNKHQLKHADSVTDPSNATSLNTKSQSTQPPTSKATDSTKNSDDSSSTQNAKPECSVAIPVDYGALQPLGGTPSVGSRIAYKTLEMSSSYTPVMSDFREAKVLAYDGVTRMAEVELAPQFRQTIEYDDDGHPVLGKFDIFDSSDIARLEAGLVQLDMASVIDCRLVAASSQ